MAAVWAVFRDARIFAKSSFLWRGMRSIIGEQKAQACVMRLIVPFNLFRRTTPCYHCQLRQWCNLLDEPQSSKRCPKGENCGCGTCISASEERTLGCSGRALGSASASPRTHGTPAAYDHEEGRIFCPAGVGTFAHPLGSARNTPHERKSSVPS